MGRSFICGACARSWLLLWLVLVGRLAFPLIDQRVGAGGHAVVEQVAEPDPVGGDQRDDHRSAGRRESADQADRDLRVVGVGDAPQLVAAGLAHPAQCRQVAPARADPAAGALRGPDPPALCARDGCCTLRR